MSTTPISWIPPLSNDPVETSQQVLKALKCVAVSSDQVGDMLKRRRSRLETRLQASSDETQLLRAHIVENVLVQRQRLEQLRELQDDIERAQTLGNAELLKELADERKMLRCEDQRTRVLRRNLKRTLRSRVHAHKRLVQLQHAVDEELVVCNCKNSLIQSMVATCSKTIFISASEYEEEEEEEDDDFSGSDYDLSDFLENDDMDVDYPKLRLEQPKKDEVSVSTWSYESDSQGSSSVTNSRRRSVSFGPLPLSGRAENGSDQAYE